MRIEGEDPGGMIVPDQELVYFDVSGDLVMTAIKESLLTCSLYAVEAPYDWMLPDGTVAAVALTSLSRYEAEVGVNPSAQTSTMRVVRKL